MTPCIDAGWPKDPDGEMRLDTFTISWMEWLKINDEEYYTRALSLSMRYLVVKGFVPFDLQREIIDYAEAKKLSMERVEWQQK